MYVVDASPVFFDEILDNRCVWFTFLTEMIVMKNGGRLMTTMLLCVRCSFLLIVANFQCVGKWLQLSIKRSRAASRLLGA